MSVHWDDGILVLTDEVDLDEAPALRHMIDDARSQGRTELVVDAHLCTLIDSTVIGCLIHADKVGLDVTIRRPSAFVARVLDVSGIVDQIVTIAD